MDYTSADAFDVCNDSESRPGHWANPVPSGRYNLVIIGGGTAGLAAALAAVSLGGRTALVDRHALGGSGLELGPGLAKAVWQAARTAYDIRRLDSLGVPTTASTDSQLLRLLERSRSTQSQDRLAWRVAGQGIDVFLGHARFIGPQAIDVDGARLSFVRAIVATGTRPSRPQAADLDAIGYQTSDTIFAAQTLPRTLVVLGADAPGCALAQAFCRFGSEVHLLAPEDGILPHEDRRAASVIEVQLLREGVRLHRGAAIVAAHRIGRRKSLVVESHGARQELIADEVLVSSGREAQVAGLELAAAGIEVSAAGIQVDERLQTSNPAVFAAGDVCSLHHADAAEAMGRLAALNALRPLGRKFDRLATARVVWTDPQLAQVGLTPVEAERRGIDLDSYRVDLAEVEGQSLQPGRQGFAVLHTRRGTARAVGATVVAANAGDLIVPLALSVAGRLPLAALTAAVQCDPEQAEVLRRISDAVVRQRRSPRVQRALERWLAWRRCGPEPTAAGAKSETISASERISAPG